MSQTAPDLIHSLTYMVPINGLAPQYQRDIINHARLKHYAANSYVFRRGDRDNYSYYLLEGELELYDGPRLVKQVTGGTPQALRALAQLQPRQMTAKARTPVTMAVVDRSLLDKLLVLGNEDPAGGEMVVDEIEATDSGDWMTRVLQSELFNRIPAVNIQQIFARMESVAKSAGERVISQGEPGDYYYIIQNGRCEVTRSTSSGAQEIRLAELSDGDSFGEEALLSDAPRNASITMLTDGSLMRLDKKAFDELIKQPALNGVDFRQAEELAAQGWRWLDVRFPDEHKDAVVEDSLNIPLYVLRMEAEKLPRDKHYIVFCDTGSRSSVGAFLLTQRGFDACYLKGGVMQSPIADHLGTAVAPPRPETGAARQGGTPPHVSEATLINALKREVLKTRAQLKQALTLKSQAEAERKDLESRLQAEFSKALDDEHERHQAEIARLKKDLEQALRWREAAERARREAAEKAEQMIAEFQEGQEEELARLETERKALEAERQRLEETRKGRR